MDIQYIAPINKVWIYEHNNNKNLFEVKLIRLNIF